MLLDHYQIPHEKVLIDFHKGEHRTPEYLQIHPYGRIPALRLDDITIVESGAITLYLADVYAEKMNTPAVGTPERARLYEWVLFIHSTLEPEAIKSFDPAQKDAATAKVRELLQAMASRFQGPFALGATESVLDVILHVEFTWYQMLGLFPDDLEPYATFMKSRPALVPAS